MAHACVALLTRGFVVAQCLTKHVHAMMATDVSTRSPTYRQAEASVARQHAGGSFFTHSRNAPQKEGDHSGARTKAKTTVHSHVTELEEARPKGSPHSRKKKQTKENENEKGDWYDSCGSSTSRSRVESRRAHTCPTADEVLSIYRLADAVKLDRNRTGCKKPCGSEVLARFPHSIAADYFGSTKTPNDYEVSALPSATRTSVCLCTLDQQANLCTTSAT